MLGFLIFIILLGILLLYKKRKTILVYLEDKKARKAELNAFNSFYSNILDNKDFINKNTSKLKDFIINSHINDYDLYKLAQLNQIELQIGKGWNSLVLDLIQELHEMGWNKKVTCIKEKYGGLSFYPETIFTESNRYLGDILDDYKLKSEEICETCGKKGEWKDKNGVFYTGCDIHYSAKKQKP